jgi:hypothetical protein
LADASALLVAGTFGTVSFEVGSRPLQLSKQLGQLDHLLLGFTNFRVDQCPELLLNRAAFSPVIGDKERRNFLKRAPQLFGTPNEPQSFKIGFRVATVPIRSPLSRLRQTQFVVAKRRGRKATALRSLPNAETQSLHPSTVNLQVGMRVKQKIEPNVCRGL